MRSFKGVGDACTLHGREAVIAPSEAAAIRSRALASALRGVGAVVGRLLFPPDPFGAVADAMAASFQRSIAAGRRMAVELEALGARLRELDEHDRRKARRRARRTGDRFRVEVRRGRRVYVFRRRGAEGER